MPKKRPRTEPNAPAGILPLITAALRGTAIACAVGLLLLLAATALAYVQDDPDRITAPLGYAVTTITALLAGFLTSRRVRRAVLLCGLFSAALVLLVCAGLSLIPVEAAVPTTPVRSLVLHTVMVLPAVGGAYLGRRRGRR